MKTIYVRMSMKMTAGKDDAQSCEAWLSAQIKGFTRTEVEETMVPMLAGDSWVVDRIWEGEEE